MTPGARRGDDAARPRAQALRTLDAVVAERRVKYRDCRDCRNFQPAEDGLQYGWCAAHKQHVKLYHPSHSWYSQCLFKSLRRAKPEELAGTGEQTGDSDVSADRLSSSDCA